MMFNKLSFIALSTSLLIAQCFAADVVPTEVQMPGTQQGQAGNFESPDKCDNCHSGYNKTNPEYEPATGWRGSAMANASRDPIFWATMAVAEQDFDGAGDFCIRCHSTKGWYEGHSTPTDGSGIPAMDDNGVDCDTCHVMTNTDNSDPVLQGAMTAPFIANCSDKALAPSGTCQSANEGFYGSGILSLWSASSAKLGPYVDADARHQFMQSKFHRHVDFCGSCHDVSNPVVGDLAPGNGTQPGAPQVISSQDASGTPNVGGSVVEKAAFNNPPYAYGVVERTFSEYKASAFPTTQVADFLSLPENLRHPGGAIEQTYQAALLAGTGGNYADGDIRYFSCQSCHMRPVQGAGANKRGVQVRKDLPQHDFTGGNSWIGDVIKYQDSRSQLRLGDGLTTVQLSAIDLATERAKQHLQQAANLSVAGNLLTVVNLTGHKLISGYPEGRRMWLNIKWYDGDEQLLREDGAYGPIGVTLANPAGGAAVEVESIVDLTGANTRIYSAHYGITQAWAERLVSLGVSGDIALAYDRFSGEVVTTLADLAAGSADSVAESFHFALNNYVAADNRIPPYGMSFDEAKRRNALPVPANQFGAPGVGGVYEHYDRLTLNPPAGAVYATIDLFYQGTSWEYIQFLYLANNRQSAFLGAEGDNMLEAWLNTGMAKPQLMASTTWGSPPVTDETLGVSSISTGYLQQSGKGKSQTTTFIASSTMTVGDEVVIRALVQEANGELEEGAVVSMNVTNTTTLESFTLVSGASDSAGVAEVRWKTSAPNRKGNGGTTPGTYTISVTDVSGSWDGVPTSSSFNLVN
ncbi:cytochrome c family protein [Shewanella sp. Isolate8]|uniref:cytochrome c family protein n=1 Tax=Shewanella sp. Isolate8 TaxID=2908529 RepID=UPI001EFECD94|nr:cytochrome c family protein [Shewanella sp. Isolate8]MCG9747558.1 cytochrome c family protein [Shewanella sp. Isolate8]